MIINQYKNKAKDKDVDKSKSKQGIPMHVFRDDTTPSKIRIEVGTPIGDKVTPIDQKEANYVAQSLRPTNISKCSFAADRFTFQAAKSGAKPR